MGAELLRPDNCPLPDDGFSVFAMRERDERVADMGGVHGQLVDYTPKAGPGSVSPIISGPA